MNGGQWPQAEGWQATLGPPYGLEGEEEPTKETEVQPVSPEGSEEGRVFGEGRSGHLGDKWVGKSAEREESVCLCTWRPRVGLRKAVPRSHREPGLAGEGSCRWCQDALLGMGWWAQGMTCGNLSRRV